MQNFKFSRWSRDHFSAPFKGLYLPNVVVVVLVLVLASLVKSQTLHTSKRHTFRVSAFHQYHWFGVKLFPVGCAQDSQRVLYKREKCCFWIWFRPRYKIPDFFTIAPVFNLWLFAATEIAAIRRVYIGLRVRYKYYKNIVVLVWSGAAHAPIAVLKVAHKCILYNNKCVQNFIQIGWDLSVREPNTCFWTKQRKAVNYR